MTTYRKRDWFDYSFTAFVVSLWAMIACYVSVTVVGIVETCP